MKTKYILLLIALLSISPIIQAQTNVSGIIDTNTNWSLADSPFILTGNVLVASGATLTIEAGVTVKVNSGLYIKNEGVITAVGDSSNKITFESNANTPTKSDWSGIRIITTGGSAIDGSQKYTSGSIFKYVVIKHANVGLYIYNSGLHVSYTEFYANNYGVEIRKTDGVVIDSSTFTGNTAGVFSEYETFSPNDISGNILNTYIKNSKFENNDYGIDLIINQRDFKNLNIINNIIINNNIGIDFGGGGYGPRVHSVLISENIVYNSRSYGVNLNRVYGQGAETNLDYPLEFTKNIIVNNSDGSLMFEYSPNVKFKIHNNILVSNATDVSGIASIGSPSTSNHLFNNNTIISKGKNVYFGGSSSYYPNSITFSNNLFINSSNNDIIDIKYGAGHVFNNNNLIRPSSTGYLLRNQTANSIDAINNFWGTASESEIKAAIYDYSDDFELGAVNFTPFSTTPNTSAPISPPSNVTKTVSGSDVVLSWSANAEADVAGYRLYYGSPTGYSYSTTVDLGNVTTYTVTGGDIATEFSITAYDSSLDGTDDMVDGNESWYSIANSLPEPPTNILVDVAPRKSRISWILSSSDDITGYKIFRGTSPNPTTLLTTLSSTITLYEDIGLSNGTTYYYAIKTIGKSGVESAASQDVMATPTNTWHVSTSGTVDGFGSSNAPMKSIGAAINLAISKDTVLVGPGIYKANLIFGGKDIVLKSFSGPKETILEPLNRGIAVIWFTGGETINSIVDGFTIRNGGNVRGSAINIQSANPIIKNVILLNNGGEGAINSWNSSPYLENCVINGSNTSIFFDSNPATPVINHCTLLSGLINNQSYTPIVNNSIILGGASGNLIINNSIVEGGFIGNNIFDINPLLTDPINDDFSLSAFSPAIGIGDSTLRVPTDILGNPRSNPSTSKPDVGAYESPLGIPTALPVIDGLNAEGTQEFKVSLNWNKQNQQLLPEKFFQHIIVYKGSSQDSLVPQDTLKAWASNWYSDSIVIPDTFYYALSISDVNGREGSLSQTLQVVSPNISPQAPQNLLVSLTDTNAVRLSFDVATETDYTESSVQGGLDFLNLAPADTIYIQNGSVIAEFNNLPYQSNWIIKAEHVDFSGNISEASFTTIRTGDPFAPDTPTGLTALAEPELVSLSWHPSVAADLAQYRIYRGSDSTSVSLIDSVDANTTRYLDSKVINAVTYYYRISAVDSAVGIPSVTFDPANESALSFAASAIPPDLVPPDSPTILSFGSSNSRVSFTWSPVSAADLAGYYIYRGASQSELDKIDSVSANVTTYTDLTLVNGNVYYYRVAAVDTNNNISIPSAFITGSPRNALPRAVTIEDRTYNNVENSTIAVRLSALGSSDADGSIVSTTWYAASELVSTNFDFEFQAPQGSTKIKLVVMDNDLGKDSTTFYINVNAGFRSFSAQSADNAGISLIGNNYLFYPLAGGLMQILNSSFESRFDLSVGGEIRSVSSIAPDTTVYLSSTDRIVYSFDKRGIPLWDTPLGGALQATPTIDTKRNLIYVGVSNSNLFAINRTTGIVVWSFRLPNPLTQPGIILQDRYLLIITQEGEATYFDLDNPVVNRELLPTGSLNLSEVISTAPAVDRDGFIFTSTNSGKLLKYEFRDNIASGGQIIWQVQTTGKFNASPVIGYDGTVYVGASDSLLYAFDGLSGTIKWQHKMGAAISTTAAINDLGIVYVGDTSGRINAIDELGNLLWYYQSNGAIGNAMAYSDGNLIFSTLQGNLYKVYDGWRFQAQLKSKTPQDKKPQWGTYQANNRRSGSTQDQVSTSTEKIIELPVDYFLSQNYPNPFNPSTQIQYGLPKEAQVELTVYNMLGQVVANLVNQKQSAGLHSITFDASGLSSGFYIYRIQADNFVSTKKMILIK